MSVIAYQATLSNSGTQAGPVPVSDPVAQAATALTDFDTMGAAVIAISGDAYSSTTHQFTTTGATGLTSAQLHTIEGDLNTVATDIINLKALISADVTLTFNAATVTTRNQLNAAIDAIKRAILGGGVLT